MPGKLQSRLPGTDLYASDGSALPPDSKTIPLHTPTISRATHFLSTISPYGLFSTLSLFCLAFALPALNQESETAKTAKAEHLPSEHTISIGNL